MKVVNILLGILTVILGGYCMFRPGMAFISAAWMLGVLLILAGVNMLVFYFQHREGGALSVVKSILLILVGLILLFNNFTALFTDTVILYMIGFGFIVGGIVQIVKAVSAKKKENGTWGWVLLEGILLVIGGIFAVAHPLITAVSVGFFMAFSILFSGISMLVEGFEKE